jgi:hypothetical protein
MRPFEVQTAILARPASAFPRDILDGVCIPPFDSTGAAVAGPGDFELELGPLGLFFDAARKRVYVICGEGRVDMFQQESADRYSLIESSKTWPGARTGLFVAGTSRLYVAAPASATSSARILVYEIH